MLSTLFSWCLIKMFQFYLYLYEACLWKCWAFDALLNCLCLIYWVLIFRGIEFIYWFRRYFAGKLFFLVYNKYTRNSFEKQFFFKMNSTKCVLKTEIHLIIEISKYAHCVPTYFNVTVDNAEIHDRRDSNPLGRKRALVTLWNKTMWSKLIIRVWVRSESLTKQNLVIFIKNKMY